MYPRTAKAWGYCQVEVRAAPKAERGILRATKGKPAAAQRVPAAIRYCRAGRLQFRGWRSDWSAPVLAPTPRRPSRNIWLDDLAYSESPDVIRVVGGASKPHRKRPTETSCLVQAPPTSRQRKCQPAGRQSAKCYCNWSQQGSTSTQPRRSSMAQRSIVSRPHSEVAKLVTYRMG